MNLRNSLPEKQKAAAMTHGSPVRTFAEIDAHDGGQRKTVEKGPERTSFERAESTSTSSVHIMALLYMENVPDLWKTSQMSCTSGPGNGGHPFLTLALHYTSTQRAVTGDKHAKTDRGAHTRGLTSG